MAVAEDGDRDDQRQERDGVVGPALGQDLADQVIGNEVVRAGACRPFIGTAWAPRR